MLRRLLFATLTFAGLIVAVSASAQAPVKMTIATGVDTAYGAFYVAKLGGFFDRNGLDVTVKTGASGSAMVALLIGNQVQAAFGTDIAGIQDFNLDPNVVMIAEGGLLLDGWLDIVGRNIDSMEQLKGKKLGVSRGTGSEVFWNATVKQLQLNPTDYKIVQVEAPEMVAAIERGDIDAFSGWEPWVTRTLLAVPNTKVLHDAKGMVGTRIYIYINKGWAEKNPDAAVRFMKSIVEATDLMNTDPKQSAQYISDFLKMDLALAEALLPKSRHDIRIDQGSIENYQTVEEQLKVSGKLEKPVDYEKLLYPDLLRKVRPGKVDYALSH